MILTPYHPVRINNVDYFPINIGTPLPYGGYVYDVVLSNRGLLMCCNVYGATFGHTETSDIFQHDYFGSEQVVNDLKLNKEYCNGYIESFKTVTEYGNERIKRMTFT